MPFPDRPIGERYSPPISGWRWTKDRLRNVTNVAGMLGISVATAGHAWFKAPIDVQFNELPMPLRGLHPDMEGFRIVQISDLHTGKRTPVSYLKDLMHRANDLPTDLTVVTGDLVTSSLKWVRPACDLVAMLEGRILVTFGNHDYSQKGDPWISGEVADALEEELTGRHIEVLRDRAVLVTRGRGKLWVVGMEDYWFPTYSPDEAFAQVDDSAPIIALSHNPDTGFAMSRRGAQWTLAGHTHGGQLRIPVLGPLMLPVDDKSHDQGLFKVGDGMMYVSRGVGAKLRVRFRCRPEVTTFVLNATLGAGPTPP